MRKNTASALALILLLFLTGCATKIIAYAPTATMNNMGASEIVEELIMTQPSKWKPDHIKINNNFILWDFGSVSESNPLGNIESHDINKRIYFNSITEVRLISQKRVSGQWYVVAIIGKNPGEIYHTQDINDAKRFIDALESLIAAYKK